ncbi:hypothetical protein HNV12_15560 [Methanococcoides sp. SA1]|nr:hypothetical protein [Methanococcoides sp. SA1]
MEEKESTAKNPEFKNKEILHTVGEMNLGLHIPPSLSNELPALDGIEYMPHKSAGLQSASDMWIDKARMTDSLQNKPVIEKILKGRTL